MTIRDILHELINRKMSIDEAEKLLKLDHIDKIYGAVVDHHRKHRTGIPEVIHGEYKDSSSIINIAETMINQNGIVMITRISEDCVQDLKQLQIDDRVIEYYQGGTIVLKTKDYVIQKTGGKVGIITAGTSDISVAEECRATALLMGCEVITAYDVGIAGLHRLLKPLKKMIEADIDVIGVCAGMEGALPSVVAGLVDVPVIGIPVSTGYGLGAKGMGALTGMLQSCSPGLTVVNIDNGFNAGATAALIANRIARHRNNQDSKNP